MAIHSRRFGKRFPTAILSFLHVLWFLFVLNSHLSTTDPWYTQISTIKHQLTMLLSWPLPAFIERKIEMICIYMPWMEFPFWSSQISSSSPFDLSGVIIAYCAELNTNRENREPLEIRTKSRISRGQKYDEGRFLKSLDRLYFRDWWDGEEKRKRRHRNSLMTSESWSMDKKVGRCCLFIKLGFFCFFRSERMLTLYSWTTHLQEYVCYAQHCLCGSYLL